MKTLYSLEHLYLSQWDCNFIAADNMQIRLTDKQIADLLLERQSLRDKMAHWGDELNEEEIERLSRGRY
jgi:hypothetical protein